MINTVDDLFEKADDVIKNYPESILRIPEMKEYFTFFPGGYGTFDKSKDIIEKKFRYMFLGQDWGTKELYYDPKQQLRTKNKNPTVDNLDQFIEDLNMMIELKECFLTNAIMGMRKDLKSTGKSPAWQYPDFMNQCKTFLKLQIETIKPKFVFVMGKETAHFVAETFEIEDWRKIKNIKTLFGPDKKFLKTINNGTTRLIFMTHPSFRPTNIKKRWGIDNDEELKLTRKELIGSRFIVDERNITIIKKM